MIELQKLHTLAVEVVNQPWGCGHPKLQANSESWEPYLRFLNAFVRLYQPRFALECGVYMGTATAHMALGNPGTIVVGIDLNFHLAAAYFVADFPNIRLIQGNSTSMSTAETVSRVIQPGSLGLLFLDSAHDGFTPMMEFQTYRQLFAPECLVVCDDLNYKDTSNGWTMRKFWEWLPGEKMAMNFLHPPMANMPEPGFGISIVRS